MSPTDSPSLPFPTRVRRFTAVARMVVTIYVGYKARQAWGAITGASSRPDYYDAWHTRSAEMARDTALGLEGLLIKACQFAGSRADILPPQFIDILAQLQDRVPPRPFEEIRPWLEAQLGRPLEQCYAHIEPTPLASASLAQVHRGKLHDGSDVAIKIQYPRIERVIATDLANFAFFIRLLARIERTFDFRILLDELYKYIPLELDFVNEAANARRFGADFADDPQVVFPTPVAALCTRTVLTMNYIEGVKITDLAGLERIGVDKHHVAELLARTYIRQILVHGFFHGDPHPGNLLVQRGTAGPVLVILDLGLAKEFTPALRDGLIRLTTAIIAQDAAAVGEAFRQLGFRTRTGSDDTFVTIGELFLGQALRAGRAYADLAMVERINDELMRALRANPIVRASSDLLLVLRVMGLLSGIGKTLDSKVDPLAAMMPFLGMSFSPLRPTR
ncbi:MAG TPA: AarF/ABC1/UbiB kinase family protein [Candidatus Limnocylindrales bacterium]|nr:AarF/ABC1/UbiB kinase family protein [Candidatus Limnocylindrales bacterium]